MQIKVNMTLRDMLWFNVSIFPRIRANFITFALIAFGVFIYLSYAHSPATPRAWVVIVISSFGGALGAMIACLLLGLATTYFTASKRTGQLGEHTYTISPEGLHEVTVANDTMAKWSSVMSIKRTADFVLIQINYYLFHVIPRRAFVNEAEDAEFWRLINAYWIEGKKNS